MKISHREEAEVEEQLIRVLGEGHNQWTYRPDLKSEEDLWVNLRQKIISNNQAELNDFPLTDKEFETIKTELLLRTKTPFDAAKWLKGENGMARITIEREDPQLGSVSLILYSNQDIGGGISTYEVVHQIAKRGSNIEARDRRFDVTLLINGLPIVQIELKQVTAKDSFYQAFNQIKKYAEEGMFRNNIFSTLQLFVVSNEQTTRYFANALPKDLHPKFLFSWRTKDNKKVENLYEFCKQVLNIPDAHRLIADYTIVSEDQDNKILMVLHPYQVHAIQALFIAANKHQSGYVWHATGSGKTLTSFVSTKLLARKSGIDRTIMLVDRKDLDNQTTTEFTKFASEFNTGISSGNAKANSLIVGTGSAKELSETLLADANANVVIITTRQKLDAALKYAKKQEEKKGTNRFQKLMGQHIVFVVETYAEYSPEQINRMIDQMEPVKKESYLDPTVFEADEHIQKVIHKMFRPDNAYTKFDFRNGRPTKSAILTTSSIDMAKKYYRAIKEMTKEPDWLTKEFPNQPIREGRTMEDPDFPRIAITYSLEENSRDSSVQQEEMQKIIEEYNQYYDTSWSLADIERYNGDINNRLARKRAEFKQFGKQIDLVIVVDRLLTGFDAPTIQTLFVDRNLEYAGLIQAFSRTNRTYPEKTKGLIVTFRKPATMEKNVEDATKLYSEAKEESGLIYPSYQESKKRFKQAYGKLKEVSSMESIDEHTPLEIRIEYVKAFQELNRAYESLVTYDDYNDDMVKSSTLNNQIQLLEEQIGVYETVKGSLIEEEPEKEGEDFSTIEFYSENTTKLYDIDSTYIDQLLGTYAANSSDAREEIEKALAKLNKTEGVKEVYRQILNAFDVGTLDSNEDIFVIKRRYFTQASDDLIHVFSNEWFVSEKELHASNLQYMPGEDPIPNMKAIINSKDYEGYKANHPEAKPFKYPQEMKRAWRKMLDDELIPLENELR
ncbi:deoxyribonuclease [Enterococcus faecium]|nr:deoxyribonuclease [Enterococcus faecium]